MTVPPDENEEARNLPVLANGGGHARDLAVPLAPSPLDRPASSSLAPQAAAAGGFLAGIAALVLVRLLRRGRSPLAVRRRRLGRRRGKGGALEVTGSRSFLVDVHVLKR